MKSLRQLGWLFIITAAGVFALGQAFPGTRIISPRSGEKTANSFVNVQYQLLTPALAASSPTFQLRLDALDPVQTTDTQHTFTGLAPGVHTIFVEVVDANNIPITGTRSQVQFTVLPQGPPTSRVQPGHGPRAENPSGRMVNAAWQADDGQSTSKLPDTDSSLPLLSMIGMGVLVGGIASALRTRPSDSRQK